MCSRILAHPRLHITLLAMNQDGYRVNGGIGFCIDTPSVLVSVTRSRTYAINDSRRNPLEEAELVRLRAMAENASRDPVEIAITGEMPSHFGFGSATAIRLAAVEGISQLNGHDFGQDELVRQSGRGGTSGVGVTTYFAGGLVFDIGSSDVAAGLMPSSVIEKRRLAPLVLLSIKMPTWAIGLCIPSGICPQSEEQERSFFSKACPVPMKDVHEALYHVVYGLIAGAKEEDYSAFTRAIRNIQSCTWKRLERELYGQQLMEIESQVYAAGAIAVGMSSLGPGLYFFADDLEKVVWRLTETLPQHRWTAARCCNVGRTRIQV